jgi:hypothetical protein
MPTPWPYPEPVNENCDGALAVAPGKIERDKEKTISRALNILIG